MNGAQRAALRDLELVRLAADAQQLATELVSLLRDRAGINWWQIDIAGAEEAPWSELGKTSLSTNTPQFDPDNEEHPQ